MKALPFLVLYASLGAQASLPISLRPDQTDLSGKTELPFMCANARVQAFYEARELPATSLLVSRLLLRYDGPSGGQPRLHVIQKLTVSLGVTAKDTATLGAVFAENLTQPLAVAYAQAQYQYLTDVSAQAGPEPFGGQFRLVLQSPIAVSVPAGGSLALDVVVEGNSNAGLDPAHLDFHVDPAVQALGSSTENGRGCPTDPFGTISVLDTQGTYRPGTPILLFGSGYPPNAPVVMLLTAKRLGTPLALPGTDPICWIYLDIATGNLEPLATTTAAGTFGPFTGSGGGSSVPIPKGPGMCGAVLYVQTASPTPLSPNNRLGYQTSNYRTIVLGCAQTPRAGTWFAGNCGSATAAVATTALEGGPALRVE